MSTEPDDLIGTTEAARLLGKSPRTVHRMVQSGDLQIALVAPGGNVGVYLFRRSDITAIIDARDSSKAAS